MKKSASTPNFQSRKIETVPTGNGNTRPITKIPSITSIVSMVPLELMGVEAMMNVSIATGHECALLNKDFPDKLLHPEDSRPETITSEEKSLAFCLATPNPDQYVPNPYSTINTLSSASEIEDSSRFGELLMRVRRQRRVSKRSLSVETD